MWLLPIFSVDFNHPFKDLLFPHGPNLVKKKPLYLVGSVLKDLTTTYLPQDTRLFGSLLPRSQALSFSSN